jgi:hypothetical protein
MPNVTSIAKMTRRGPHGRRDFSSSFRDLTGAGWTCQQYHGIDQSRDTLNAAHGQGCIEFPFTTVARSHHDI